LLNVAVGNPQKGAETDLLLPAAEAAVRNGGWLSYHGYFPAHPQHAERWITDYASDYHLRALDVWDAQFAAHGLAPRYLFTECGAVSAVPNADGSPGPMNSGGGWRYNLCLRGDLARYIALLRQWRGMVATWNATHGNRAEMGSIFTTGAHFIGWDHFIFNGPELAALADALGY